MKKIGIITFHSAHNYGAMLQAYALQSKLRQEDVKIIDYRNKNIDKVYRLIKVSKNPIKAIKLLYKSLKNYKSNKKRYDSFNSFMLDNYKLTERYNSLKELKNRYPKCDVYITGSDQVWNPDIVGELSDAYTLNFGDENIKRTSYAASIGNSKIEEKYKNDYRDKLNKIDCISVREETARENLKKIIDKNIDVVLDPTLLLTKEEWDENLNKCKNNNISEKYILAYVVEPDEEYNKIVNYLSEKTGLKVVHFEIENRKLNNVLESAYTQGPFEFVNLIKNAEYVVATSFHATVFSVIYNRKFVVVPHRKTASRVINLLEKLDIQDRIFYNLEELKNKDYDSKIDWNKVEKNLNKEREHSIKWLENAINIE